MRYFASMSYDVILPAGGSLPDEFAQAVGTKSKALVKLDGQSVLKHTLTALRDSGLAKRIAVIGTQEVQASEDSKIADLVLPETESGPMNIMRGLENLASHADATKKVLVITCDLPFVTADVIKKYVGLCPGDKDICVPLISEKEYEDRFPGTHATYVKLKDNTWTTGCLYLMDSFALRNAQPHIEKVFENRKSVTGLAKLLGPAFVLKWVMKKLTVDDVEGKIVQILGCSGAAVRNSPPELAFDIDYLHDYEYAVQHSQASGAVSI